MEPASTRGQTPASGNWDGNTVPQRAVRPASSLSDTVELPVVDAQVPTPATPAPTPPTPAPTPALRPPAGKRPRRRRRAWAAAVALVGLIAVVGVGSWFAAAHRPGKSALGQSAGQVLATRSVTSVDPAGGSGLREADNGGWRTQRYRTAEYGGLKPGVGLLVDLGEPRRVRAATLTASPGTALELWAGDRPTSSPAGYRSAARQDAGVGATTLRVADAGSHRYWLVWVSRLGPQGDGYATELRGLTVTG